MLKDGVKLMEVNLSSIDSLPIEFTSKQTGQDYMLILSDVESRTYKGSVINNELKNESLDIDETSIPFDTLVLHPIQSKVNGRDHYLSISNQLLCLVRLPERINANG